MSRDLDMALSDVTSRPLEHIKASSIRKETVHGKKMKPEKEKKVVTLHSAQKFTEDGEEVFKPLVDVPLWCAPSDAGAGRAGPGRGGGVRGALWAGPRRSGMVSLAHGTVPDFGGTL